MTTLEVPTEPSAHQELKAMVERSVLIAKAAGGAALRIATFRGFAPLETNIDRMSEYSHGRPHINDLAPHFEDPRG